MRTFDPWQGNRYKTDGINGKRLLILGEAHRGNPGTEYQIYTINIIREMASQKSELPIFARIQHIVFGTRGFLSNAARKDFWERVAFSNFIQAFPGLAPKSRPTPAMWLAAREPLLQTLEELNRRFYWFWASS